MTPVQPALARPRSVADRPRLAIVPAADPYVDEVLPPGVVRVGPSSGPGPWLDATYLADHADEIDVLHLHTGSGRVRDAAVQCWSETVRRAGVPLVVTVHRVRAAGTHPHAEPDAVAAEEAHLQAVLSTAEVVLTLTPGAADAIAERFGRTAIVLAHPSVARPEADLGAERGLVGLRLPAADQQPRNRSALVRAALSGAVSGGGRLRVLVEPGTDVPPSVRELAAGGELELGVLPEGERAAQLQRLHVAVLPEPCGTHSRDLEICRDVGTRVVAPSCGWSSGQWAEVVSYSGDHRGELDALSLSVAVSAALTRPMLRPADREWRREQRAAVRRVHAEVYAQVADDRGWC